VWLLAVFLDFCADAVAFFWFFFVGPRINDPDESRPAPAPAHHAELSQLDAAPRPDLNNKAARAILVPPVFRKEAEVGVEVAVNDSSFLAQLEKRTQQVKSTLAHLESEKLRIEGLIAQLEPVVPRYDALIEAERAVSAAVIGGEPEAPAPAAATQAPRWGTPEREREPSTPSGQ
jgi:hypothetical protein